MTNRILVIDDNIEHVHKVLNDFFSSYDNFALSHYLQDENKSIEKFITFLDKLIRKQQEPCAILLDAMMPNVKPDDFISVILEKIKAPIILYTNDITIDKNIFYEKGVISVAIKSGNYTELASKLEAICKYRHI
jgi:DNA-binding response OmpR family regulator